MLDGTFWIELNIKLRLKNVPFLLNNLFSVNNWTGNYHTDYLLPVDDSISEASDLSESVLK